jgi:hypothetical protein
MQIKRKLKFSKTTTRRILVTRLGRCEQVFCPSCGAEMLEPWEAAQSLGISQRVIFQSIETGAVHFCESGEKSVFVCPLSLAELW